MGSLILAGKGGGYTGGASNESLRVSPKILDWIIVTVAQ
jgi:hypothetical protein